MRRYLLSGAAVAIVLLGILFYLPRVITPGHGQRSGNPASIAPVAAPAQTALPPSSRKRAVDADVFTQLPSDQLPDAGGEPLWGAEIGPVPEGRHDYRFNVDGMEAPLAYVGSQSFIFPPDPDQKLQKRIGRNRVQFYYVGRIKRFAWFISTLTELEWGLHEMRPLNDAARANLQEALADPGLARCEGVVVDAADHPIANARVQVRRADAFERVAQCDEAGQFHLDRLPPMNLAFVACGSEYAANFPLNVSPNASGKFPPVKIVLQRGTPVLGCVTDENSKPVPMATVQALGGHIFRTDEQGYYFLGGLTPGNYTFAVAEEKTGTISRTVTIPSQTTPFVLDFKLVRGGKITVKAIRLGTNGDQPASKALFKASASSAAAVPPGQQFSFTQIFETDAQGLIDFAGVPYGLPILVGPQSTPYSALPDQGQTVTLERGKPAPTLEFRLDPLATVHGCVLDMEGKAIAGAEIYPECVAPGMRPIAVADNEGKYVCQNLPISQSILLARAKGYALGKSREFSTMSDEDVVIVLKEGITVKGQVISDEDSGPVADMKLSRSDIMASYDSKSADCKTDAEGRFVFEDLTASKWRVIGEKNLPDSATLFVHEELDLKDGIPAQERVFVATPGRTLSGRAILQETGKPIPNLGIKIISSNGLLPMGEISIVTSSEGKFEAPNLIADEYNIQTENSGFLMLPKSEDEDITKYEKIQEMHVKVEKGSEPDPMDLFFSKGGIVSGEVVDAYDKPVNGCWLTIPEGTAGFGCTDANGHFSVSGFDYDTSYKLQADHSTLGQGFSDEFRLTKAKPQHEVRIRIGAGVSLRGKISDSDGKPLQNVDILIASMDNENHMIGGTNTPYATSDLAGNYGVPILSSRKYRITATLDGYLSEYQNVQIDAQKTTECNFTLRRGKRTGIVVDLNQREMAGISVHDEATFFKLTSSDGRFDIGCDSPLSLLFWLTQWRNTYGREASFITNEFAPTKEETIFVLPLGATVRGRLIDGVTKQPVTLSKVTIKASTEGKQECYAKSNCILTSYHLTEKDVAMVNGVFELKDIALGRMTFAFSAPTILAKTTEPMNVDLQTDLGDIAVNSGLICEGRIIDAETGKPCLVDQSVEDSFTINKASGVDDPKPSLDLFPDAQGHFRFSNVDPDAREWWIHAGLYLPAKVELGVPVNGIVDLGDIRLVKGETIVGTLKPPAGVALGSAYIDIQQSEDSSNSKLNDDNKTFTAHCLLPGPAKIYVSADPQGETGPREYRGEKEVKIIKGKTLEVEISLTEYKEPEESAEEPTGEPAKEDPSER